MFDEKDLEKDLTDPRNEKDTTEEQKNNEVSSSSSETSSELDEAVKTTEGLIQDISLSSEMKKSFLSYAMSVIVSRALPDIRDGLKPVHRRIIYGMKELGVYSNSSYKKSARIVGDVMGKYHPHGDSSIYNAMVRMAQPFSYRYPLVDGHGNFGSVDGDGAAAMRYTEARMSKLAMELVRDIDKNTINFGPNYDSSEEEPLVLPSRYPNLLVNGSMGIAVGMATDIPPHNLVEVINAIIALLENEELNIYELTDYITGPDFPTGGEILNYKGILKGYETGNGSGTIRSKTRLVKTKNKQAIIVYEIPYTVNKAKLIERIAEVAKNKIVEGITALRDESNRGGTRIVIELRRDINPDIMLNNLYKHTELQVNFNINMIALVEGEPRVVTLKDILTHYIKFQIEVITRRTQFDLEKALARLHILSALVTVLNDIDNALEIIKASRTGEIARERLITQYQFDDTQARAILDMRLQRLTGLEIEKIKEEEDEIRTRVIDLKDILSSEERKKAILSTELAEISKKYGDKRLSEINKIASISIENESLIPVEEIIVTITSNGYVKRMKTDAYKTQTRGGRGLAGIKMHEDDTVEHIIYTQTHDFILFFTNLGRVYKIKGYNIPEGSRISKGIPLVNMLNFQEDEHLVAVSSVKDFTDETRSLCFITKKGLLKKTSLNLYKNISLRGLRAISLAENDELFAVLNIENNSTSSIIVGASNGKAIRFQPNKIRAISRAAKGVRIMKLTTEETVIGAGTIINDNQNILVLTQKGLGKKTNQGHYNIQARGGKGVITVKLSERTGKVVSLKVVDDTQDLLVITTSGITIRTKSASINPTARSTQGVALIKIKSTDTIASVALLPTEEVEENSFDDVSEVFNNEELNYAKREANIEVITTDIDAENE